MSSEAHDTQVVIAGGGPSGAATAISLAARGIDCIVVEAAPEPAFKAGETIPPNALPLFRKLGIADLLQDPQHLHSYGNRFVWGKAAYDDKTFLATQHPNGWHLDRAYFEQQLRAAVTAAGVDLRTGVRISDCIKKENGWKVSLHDAGAEQQVTCSFVADATGRPARIARYMGEARQRTDNLAGITAAVRTSGLECPQYTFIEAQPGGWWYAAPLSGSRLALTWMTDMDLLDTEMQDTQQFLEKLAGTSIIGTLLDNTAFSFQHDPAILPAATSYLVNRQGDGWLAVGDAAFAYDPISSYGITSALESGYYAGHAIADYLAGEKIALPSYDWLLCSAFNAYKEMYTHQYQLEKRWENEEFWKRRR